MSRIATATVSFSSGAFIAAGVLGWSFYGVPQLGEQVNVGDVVLLLLPVLAAVISGGTVYALCRVGLWQPNSAEPGKSALVAVATLILCAAVVGMADGVGASVTVSALATMLFGVPVAVVGAIVGWLSKLAVMRSNSSFERTE